MQSEQFNNIINDIKAANSCVHFLNHHAGINIHHSGQTIHTPAFIRHGDNHPSFQVYDSICIDYATGQHYDIINLAQLYYNLDFIGAVTLLNGGTSPFPQNSASARQQSLELQQAHEQFDNLIAQWHSNIQKPEYAHILQQIKDRGLSIDFINEYMLGYDPIQKRIIFPYFKPERFTRRKSSDPLKGHYVYYNGRDTENRYKFSDKDPRFSPKYKKCKKASSPVADNTFWGLQTLRPHTKTASFYTAEDGQQYESPQEDPRDSTLCVLEGMFDAASFAQEKWQVLSPGTGNFPRALHREFIDFCRMYDRVLLCFDNDDAGAQFQKSMGQLLVQHGINFICAHVPPYLARSADGSYTPLSEEQAEKLRLTLEGNNGQESDQTIDGRRLIKIKDVNDYYCAGGNLDDLVKNAVPGLVELARSCSSMDDIAQLFHDASRFYPQTTLFSLKTACQNITDSDGVPVFPKKAVNFAFMQACKPLPEKEVAELVLKKHNIIYDTAGAFYEYTDGFWNQIADVIVQKYAGEALNMYATSGRMVSAANYIKITRSGRYQFNRKPIFVFSNGTLDLNEPDPVKRFRKSVPEDMNSSRVNYPYKHSAIPAKWLKFVARAMDNDQHKMKLLQQIAGYVLFADNRLQKFFYLYGDGRNGKSTYLNILKAVYGEDKTSSVPFSRLGSQFDPMALKNAWINLCTEAKTVLRDGEDTLKAIVGGDPIMAAHKGVDAETFTTRAKLFVAANKLFTTEDVSLGLLRRIIFMKFDNVIPAEEDNKNLYSELIEELPGIFNWCYEGYLDLVNSGEFEETEQHFDALEEFLDQMAPSMIFVREVLMDCKLVVNEKDIYEMAKHWAEEGNYKLPNRAKFISDIKQILRQMMPHVKVYREKGERIYTFRFDAQPRRKPAQTEGRVDHNEAIMLPASTERSPEVPGEDERISENAEAVRTETAGELPDSEEPHEESESSSGLVHAKLDLLESLNGTGAEDVQPQSRTCRQGDNIEKYTELGQESESPAQADGVFSRPVERPIVKRPVPYNEDAIVERVQRMNSPVFKSWREKLGEHFTTHSEWAQLAFYMYEHPRVKQEYYPDFDEQYAAWLAAHKDDPRDLGFSKL